MNHLTVLKKTSSANGARQLLLRFFFITIKISRKLNYELGLWHSGIKALRVRAYILNCAQITGLNNLILLTLTSPSFPPFLPSFLLSPSLPHSLLHSLPSCFSHLHTEHYTKRNKVSGASAHSSLHTSYLLTKGSLLQQAWYESLSCCPVDFSLRLYHEQRAGNNWFGFNN